jgi:hypothetical protein
LQTRRVIVLTAVAMVSLVLVLRAERAGKTDEEEKPATKAGPRPVQKPESGGVLEKIRKGELLTKEQINRVRMAEFHRGDRVTVRFKNDVLNRFLETVAGTDEYTGARSRERFMALSNADKLAAIVKATGMYFVDDIEISTDPEAIRFFRTSIMPIVRQGCATNRCHGGAGAPAIRLHSADTTAAAYTNFYVLDSYVGPDEVQMFDRQYPEEGFFLNYLLPKEQARGGLTHPDTSPPLVPAVRSRNDPRYRLAERFLTEVLQRPRLDPEIEAKPASKAQEKATPAGAGSAKRATTRKERPTGE